MIVNPFIISDQVHRLTCLQLSFGSTLNKLQSKQGDYSVIPFKASRHQVYEACSCFWLRFLKLRLPFCLLSVRWHPTFLSWLFCERPESCRKSFTQRHQNKAKTNSGPLSHVCKPHINNKSVPTAPANTQKSRCGSFGFAKKVLYNRSTIHLVLRCSFANCRSCSRCLNFCFCCCSL